MANAIGAATARVSGIIDTIESTESKTSAQVIELISKIAIQKAVENGAKLETVQVVEMDHLPLQVGSYSPRKSHLNLTISSVYRKQIKIHCQSGG